MLRLVFADLEVLNLRSVAGKVDICFQCDVKNTLTMISAFRWTNGTANVISDAQ